VKKKERIDNNNNINIVYFLCSHASRLHLDLLGFSCWVSSKFKSGYPVKKYENSYQYHSKLDNREFVMYVNFGRVRGRNLGFLLLFLNIFIFNIIRIQATAKISRDSSAVWEILPNSSLIVEADERDVFFLASNLL